MFFNCALKKKLTWPSTTTVHLKNEFYVYMRLEISAFGDFCGKLHKHRSKHNRLKRMLFIRTRQHQQILGVIPFVELPNNTWTTAKRSKTMKHEVKRQTAYLCLDELRCFPVPIFLDWTGKS